jgi:hypothetical protein
MRERRNAMSDFGTPLRVEITEQPGLHELLEAEAQPDKRELEHALGDFMTSYGVEGSTVGDRLDDTIRTSSEATGEGLSALWQALRGWLTGEEHKVVDTEQHSLDLASYWLTVPEIHGAKVTLTSSVSSSNETSGEITIAGIGGGPTFTLKVDQEVSFKDVTKNLQVDVSAMGTFEKVEVTKDGRLVATYARLKSVDRNNVVFKAHPASLPDPKPWGKPATTKRYEVTAGNGTVTDTLTVTRGTTWELGADLSLEKLGLKAKLGTKMTYEREVSFAYEWPSGHDVVAAYYPQFPAYLWSVHS